MAAAIPSANDERLPLGDRAFLRLNMRLEPEQLPAGEVSRSENGRMDRGSWQPRRSLANLSGVLQSDGDPLELPFFVFDAVGGRTIDAGAARTGTLVELNFSVGDIEPEVNGWVLVSGLTFTGADPNGMRYVTSTGDGATLYFNLVGAVGNETYGGTGKVRAVIDDTAAAEIFGSCLFSDPSSDSVEFVVIAGTGEAYRVEVADGTVTAVPYPTGVTLAGPVDMVHAFDRVFLFRDGEQALEWFGTVGRPVVSAVLSANVVTVTLKAHGLTVGDAVTLADVGYATTDPNGSQPVTGIPTADTFTFALTGANETFTAGTGTAAAGFTKVQAGAFTQPQVFEATGGDVDVVSGLCTVTVVGNATIEAGDTVIIYGSDAAEFADFIGRGFLVTAATSTSVSFYIPVADLATISTSVLSIGKQVSVGAGFQNMPAPPWGACHQRRLIVPYRYTQSGTTAAPVFTDRNVRDELVISDILDPYTYDAIANQFRVTAGMADYLVAVHPFYEDAAVIFNHNSIHGMFGLSGSLADVSVRQLTREIGCLARKSIAQHGPEILFLSDSGVFAITFADEYNLRGVDVPLSEPIQPLIDRINADLAADAVGVYFDNRYFLAVPLDSAPGAGDATGNNAILVYNFLNQGWESVDSVDDARWSILNLHICSGGARNDLYAVNNLGGVHKIDALDTDQDLLALAPGGSLSLVPVVSALSTRQFDGQTLDRKRFTELQVQVEAASQSCDAVLSLAVEDPDSDVEIATISDLHGESLSPLESASLRARTGGQRGHGAIATIRPTAGRPKIKSARLLATFTNRSTTSQS